MTTVYVVKEEEYHNVYTGELVQIRQEMSDGSVEWRRMADGSTWDGGIDDPSSKQLSPGWRKAK